MNRERTILDDLDLIQSELGDMYKIIFSDEHVNRANYTLPYPQVKLFFILFKQGVDYLYKTYGEGCLASGLRLYSQFVDAQNRIVTDHISYDPNVDQIQLTFLHLAGQCAYYGDSSVFFTDSHLPNVRLGAQAITVLQAIEECYHRYQIRHLGYPPVPTTETMKYEQEITPVWQRAISDLNESPAFKGIQPA